MEKTYAGRKTLVHPTLFTIKAFSIFGFNLGPFSLHTYGLMIAIGFFLAMYIHLNEAKPYRLSREFVLDTSMWGIFAGIIGSRVLFVITQLDFFIKNPGEIFKIWNGGVVVYGGLIAVFIYLWFRARSVKQKALDFYDIWIPGFALGHSLGRIGCVFAGCCYGRPTDVPWAITFTNPEGIARPLHTPLHPTQIYESIANALICLALIQIRKKFKNTEADRRTRSGIVIGSYLIMYSIVRSVIEIFRGDKVRGFIIQDVLSTSQFISIFAILGGCALVWRAHQRKNA